MAYSKKVVDKFENTIKEPEKFNVGRFDPKELNVGTGMVGAPACGDVMKLQIKCEPNLVRRHKGKTIELITTRPINAGEQLTIQYSAESGHEDQSHFKCSCKRTLAERKKIAKRGREIIEDFELDQ